MCLDSIRANRIPIYPIIPLFRPMQIYPPSIYKYPQVMPSPNERSLIREVWAENLDQEMALLRDLVDHYPYLAMVWSKRNKRKKKKEKTTDISEDILIPHAHGDT